MSTNRKYNWVEMPVRAFLDLSLRKAELVFLAELCLVMEDDGFVTDDKLIRTLMKLEVKERDWKNALDKLSERTLTFFGPRSKVSDEIVGRYVGFLDYEQTGRIWPNEPDPRKLEDDIYRIQFPIELLYDTKLDRDDIFILSLCIVAAKDLKNIDNDLLLGALYYHKFPSLGASEKFERLKRLNYLWYSDDYKTFTLFPERASIFVCYSHQDEQHLKDLKRHFKPFGNSLSLWDDSQIQPSEVWEEKIDKALSEAGIAILLVSPDFFASDFIMKKELPKLLKKQKEGLKIAALLLSPCVVEHFNELRKIQFVNSFAKPLLSLKKTDRELVYLRTVNFVKETIEKL